MVIRHICTATVTMRVHSLMTFAAGVSVRSLVHLRSLWRVPKPAVFTPLRKRFFQLHLFRDSHNNLFHPLEDFISPSRFRNSKNSALYPNTSATSFAAHQGSPSKSSTRTTRPSYSNIFLIAVFIYNYLLLLLNICPYNRTLLKDIFCLNLCSIIPSKFFCVYNGTS
jgi:hypothetical protein